MKYIDLRAVLCILLSLLCLTLFSSAIHPIDSNGVSASQKPQVESSEWKKVIIPSVGSIEIPSVFKVSIGGQMVSEPHISTHRLLAAYPIELFEGKGFNEIKYAYATVSLQTGTPGSFAKFQFNPDEMKSVNLKAMYDTYRTALIKGVDEAAKKGVLAKLKKIENAKISKINGMSCVVLQSVMQIPDQGTIVTVDYFIPDDSKMYNLSLSYRASEEAYWKEPLRRIRDSFVVDRKK